MVEKIKFLSTKFLFGLNFIVLSKLIKCQLAACSSPAPAAIFASEGSQGPGWPGRGEWMEQGDKLLPKHKKTQRGGML